MEFAVAYQGYWSAWNKLHCAVYETVPDEGAKCYVYDRSSAAWPDEVRHCALNDEELGFGENLKSILFQRAWGETEPTFSDPVPNCTPPPPPAENAEEFFEEIAAYESTCDFGAENWQNNGDCWTDIINLVVPLAFFGGFFGLIAVIILAVVL